MGSVRRLFANIDELETGSSAGRWCSREGAANDKTKKANELVRALVGQVTKEGDNVAASGSKSKLWRDLSLERAIQNWNMKYVDISRSPGSALRMFTSSERLANRLTINKIGDVGKLVKTSEMGDPKVGNFGVGKLVERIEMGDMKFGELVKKIQMNEPKVGKVGRSARFGQEEYMKLEEDAMLAEAGEEENFIKCFDDITGKELPWQAEKQSREQQLKHLRGLGVQNKKGR